MIPNLPKHPVFRHRYAVIVLTALLGTLTSIGACLLTFSWEQRVTQIAFESKAKSYLEAINDDLGAAKTLLFTMSAYVDTNESVVARAKFERFAQALHVRVVGVRNIIWAPRVTEAQRSAFEHHVLAPMGIPHHDRILQRNAQGTLVPARRRPAYFPVLYVQTAPEFRRGSLRNLLGFDNTSEPIRGGAVARTIRTGQPAATPPTSIVGLAGKRTGAVAFMAVGRSAQPGKAPVTGVVISAFEIAPMIDRIIADRMHASGLDLYLYDPARTPDDRRIYWHSSASGQRNPPTEVTLRAGMHWQGTVGLIDQRWGAIVTPTSAARWSGGIWEALTVLVIGFAITALIVAYLLLSLRRSMQLESLTASLCATTEELNRNSEQMAHMARHDALTGLANRVVFQERIAEAISRSQRGASFALFYLDIDHFKDVNDTLGHDAGDQLLCLTAERIAAGLRSVDTIARLGGDEFAIILADTTGPEAVANTAERIIRDIGKPFLIQGQTVIVGASIGIAIAAAGPSPEILLKEADLALYEAKRGGRRTYRFFESRLGMQIEEHGALEGEIRRGLASGEFVVYYQPIVNVVRNSVVAFEALVRWNHPERGLLGPDRFISFAEERGLIGELGLWVLRTACDDAAHWPVPVKLAVNISPLQLKSEHLAADIARCLRDSGLPAHRLEIEITEAALLQESASTLAGLNALRAMGVTVAFDDFGTGFSSFSSLLNFPFDKLKIDRSFVGAVDTSESAAAIVRATVALGVNLRLATTGEGIETPEQLAHLRQYGCIEAQGYLFSRPRPNSDVPRLMIELNAQAEPAAALPAEAFSAPIPPIGSPACRT